MPYIGQSPTQTAFVTDTFSGTGSTTAFTMSVAPANTSSVLVAISGVLQDPSTYSVSGLTLTFSTAPPSGTLNISCRYLGIPASGVTTTAYRTVTEFTATANQTTFTPASYTVGFITVFRNGVRLGSADFTATNGTTVVLTTGATAGDLVTTESFLVSSVLNAIPATAGSISSTYLASSLTLTTPTLTSPTISSGSLTFPNGTTQSSAGVVLQVVNATYSTATSTTSSSMQASGLSLAITPKFSTSKILITYSMTAAQTNNVGNGTNLNIYKNGSVLVGSSVITGYISSGGTTISSNSATYLDSPATTSSTTYALYFASNTGGQSVTVQANGSTSFITLMEIAG